MTDDAGTRNANGDLAQRLAASGMPSIPPGYHAHFEMSLPQSIIFGRKLSLEDPSDVQLLRRASSSIPELSVALEQYLEDYLRMFQEPHWRVVYDGPTIMFPLGERRQGVYQLSILLEVAKWYKTVKHFDGAAEILKGLRNPPQIPATFFELEAAAYCASRTITRALSFAPKVEHAGGRITRPDFLWSTTLGDLFCECKRSTDLEDLFRRRVARITAFLETAIASRPMSSTRLDFVVDRTGGAEKSIEGLLSAVKEQTAPGSVFVDRHVSLTLANRLSPPPRVVGGPIRQSSVAASTSLVPLGPPSSKYTLAIKATAYWQSVAMRLIRDARTQLPKDRPGTVFVSLPVQTAAEAAKQKILVVTGQATYANTPWIGIWAQGGLTAVYRSGQPFSDDFTRALAQAR